MKRTLITLGALALAVAAFASPARAQQSNIVIQLSGGTKRVIALPDFRGSGAAAPLANTFNRTVFEDIQGSGMFEMAAKSFYPLNPPQQDSDLKAAPDAPTRRNAPAPKDCGGRCLSDWSSAPLSASYLGFGYAAEQNAQFVVFGNLFNVTVPDLNGARLFRKLYNGDLTEDGARAVAHQYANDILAAFGLQPISGSKIYFVSDRQGAGTKEIWVMDFDGSNQRRVTNYNSITTMPNVSPDGERVAFTTFAKGQPRIQMYSTVTKRYMTFLNPQASVNAQASFTPDGKSVLFASTAGSR